MTRAERKDVDEVLMAPSPDDRYSPEFKTKVVEEHIKGIQRDNVTTRIGWV